MRLVVLLAALLSLFLQGSNALYAGAHHNDIFQTTVGGGKIKTLATASSTSSIAVVSSSHVPSANDYLFDTDKEDDNENNADSRKFKLARCYVLLPCPVVSGDLHNFLKAPRPFPIHLYHKYITQSVLRI